MIRCALASCKNEAEPGLEVIAVDADGNEGMIPLCRKCYKEIESAVAEVSKPLNTSMGSN